MKHVFQQTGQSIHKFIKIIQRFWPELRIYKVLIMGSFLALFVEIFLRLLQPWPLKFVLDEVLGSSQSNGRFSVKVIQDLDPALLLLFCAIAVVLFATFRAFATYANTVGFALIGNRVLTEIRSKLYNHIQCLPLSFHTKAKSGDLLIRVIGDVGMLQDIIVTAAMPLLANTLVFLGMFCVMFWFNAKLALIAFSILPIFWLTTVRLGRKITEVSRKQRKTQSALASTTAESVNAIKTVQALSLEDTFSEKFASKSHQDLKQGVKAKRLASQLERTADVLIAFATALILFFGSRLVLSAQLSIGELVVFLAYLKNAFKPLRNFAKYAGRIAKASAAGERILEILDLTPEVRNLPDAKEAPPFSGTVTFKGVCFSYNLNQEILKSISFNVEAGEHVGLVAPSGEGKSTLVSLIMRLYDPQSGQILIDGMDVRNLTLESLRPQISIVLQDSILFSASIRDNIAFGMTNVALEDVQKAAVVANAHGFIQKLPEGYDTMVGEKGSTLSMGQRQRIAIARAAIHQSPILILDEPTTGLDKKSEQVVIDALKKLAKGRTTFLITHKLNLITDTDRILYLEDGKLQEQGTHKELMHKNHEYAKAYNFQTTK